MLIPIWNVTSGKGFVLSLVKKRASLKCSPSIRSTKIHLYNSNCLWKELFVSSIDSGRFRRDITCFSRRCTRVCMEVGIRFLLNVSNMLFLMLPMLIHTNWVLMSENKSLFGRLNKSDNCVQISAKIIVISIYTHYINGILPKFSLTRHCAVRRDRCIYSGIQMFFVCFWCAKVAL